MPKSKKAKKAETRTMYEKKQQDRKDEEARKKASLELANKRLKRR